MSEKKHKSCKSIEQKVAFLKALQKVMEDHDVDGIWWGYGVGSDMHGVYDQSTDISFAYDFRGEEISFNGEGIGLDDIEEFIKDNTPKKEV